MTPLAEAPIEVVVTRLLTQAGLSLAVAESCTGGLLGHRLTNVPGSSAVFKGGVVAYSYSAKERLLHVNHADLVRYGAVSNVIAQQMARGARNLLDADYALSITGIAGPGGGMPGKPVGLTFIGLAFDGGVLWRQHIWQGDRAANKSQSVEAALHFLKEILPEKEKVA